MRLDLRRPFATLVVAVTVSAAASAQKLVWSATGTSPEKLGSALAFVGDQNGDGIPDLAAAGLDPGGQFVRLLSGVDGSTLRSFPLNENAILVAAMPDLDGDGVMELLLGFPLHVEGSDQKGMVRVLSGVTGNEIFRLLGDDNNDLLGGSVGALGDVDGDGVPDFFASAQCYANGKRGYARVFSGANGSILYEVDGDFSGDEFGIAGTALNDVDGDGVVDFAIGTRVKNGVGPGYVRLFSGATGSTLRTIPAPSKSVHFGLQLADAGDVDSDGADDLITLDYGFPTGFLQYDGAAFLFSSATGTEIRRHLGNAKEAIELGMSGVGDANGDGVADYAIGSLTPSTDPLEPFTFYGQVRLYSGASGVNLYRFRETAGNSLYADAITGGVDVDGDGRTEIAIGAYEDGSGGPSGGLVELHSGNDLYCNVEPEIASPGDLNTITASEGVPSNLTLDAIVAVNGSPIFLIVGGLATFNGSGVRQLSGTVPPGLAGTSLVYLAFANDAHGKVIVSEPELVEFQ